MGGPVRQILGSDVNPAGESGACRPNARWGGAGVVLDVGAQGLLQMAPSHDQQPVLALGTDGANPALP
jgi:hypothetical protein